MKTLTATYASLLAAIVLLLVAAIVAFQQPALGSQPPGLPARIATTSQSLVGTTAITLFATSTCSDRIVATQGFALMLTFSDYANHTPSAFLGAPQAASTTATYPAETFGCGLVKAYSFGAQSITVSESR